MKIVHHITQLTEMRLLYRKAYQAIIKGALPYGTIGDIAQKMGVSAQFISSVISGSDEYPPSPRFIEEFIKYVSLESELRIRLQEYMIYSYERKRSASEHLNEGIKEHILHSDIQDLRTVFHNSFYAPTPDLVSQSNQIFYESGKIIASGLSTYNPLHAAEWWLHLSGKAFVLQKPDEGLIFAKQGLKLIKPFIEHYAGDDLHLYNRVYINLLLMEASAYHHLHWYKEASRLIQSIPRKIAHQTLNITIWQDLIVRESIPSMLRLPRWSIREMSDQVAKAKRFMEQQGKALREFVLIDRSLADAYRAAGKSDQAEHILSVYVRIPSADHQMQLDPMTQVMLYRTLANIRWEIGDRTLNGEWADYVRMTIHIAKSHGFKHQVSRLKETYGSIIEPLL